MQVQAYFLKQKGQLLFEFTKEGGGGPRHIFGNFIMHIEEI